MSRDMSEYLKRCPVASKKMLRGMQKDAPERNCCISFPQPRHIISTHHGIGFWVLGGIFLDSPEHVFELSGASFCSRARVHYLLMPHRNHGNHRY